jgi:phthalate 4,5-dioxygenase oxygenase subunit
MTCACVSVRHWLLGRNEECGLRCVYHGWKFDVHGNCVDMPNEPSESNFKHKIKATAYPCKEAGGVVWTYMGPPELQPGLPQLEWTLVPDAHRFATRHLQECNWFQALEGGFDTSHIPFLHRGDASAGPPSVSRVPKIYETVPTDFGFISGSGRALDNGHMYWTASVLLMPFHKIITRHGGPDAPIGAHAWVPIDDENCMNYSIEYHPDRPLRDDEMERSRNFFYIHTENVPGTDRPIQKDNDYLIDRKLQRSGQSFTGIKGIGMQDCGIQESMGAIGDRGIEHLGVSDTAIITLRRLLLRTLRDVEAGGQPPGMAGASYRVRSAAFTIPGSEVFADVVEDFVCIG